jgi:L-fucose isomerase-like protein
MHPNGGGCEYHHGLRMLEEHPKVGFVTCVHPIYDLPAVAAERHRAAESLRARGCEVAETEIPRSVSQAREIAAAIRNNDLVVLFFCTWVAEDITLALASELPHAPMLLWALPWFERSVPMPSPISGLTASASNIRRSGKRFLWTIGHENADEVARAARVARVVRGLRGARFGIFGEACPGMLDVAVDDTDVSRTFGAEAVHFEMNAVLNGSAEEAAEASQRLAALAVCRDISEEALRDNLRVYTAVRRLVRENALDAYCVRCWPEMRDQHRVTPCAAHALMAEDGIPSTCEIDLPALITTWVLSRLANAPAFNFDITAFLVDRDAIQFAHCGAAAPSLAEDPSHVRLRTHMRTLTGATVEFPFKPGQVTLAKFLRPESGSWKLFVARGEAVHPDADVRGSVAIVKPAPSARAFLDRMMREAVEHHIALVYGDWLPELRQFCELTGVECVSA